MEEDHKQSIIRAFERLDRRTKETAFGYAVGILSEEDVEKLSRFIDAIK